MIYAGFWRRLAAYLIDGALLMVAALAMLAPFGGLLAVLHVSGDEVRENPFVLLSAGLMLVGLIVGGLLGRWFYFSSFESSEWQATPGKRLLGMYVADENGKRLSSGRATIRYFARFLNHITFGIGYVLIAFSPRKQGLHDIVASTVVIQRPRVPIAPPQ